jgi:hypothetical protein
VNRGPTCKEEKKQPLSGPPEDQQRVSQKTNGIDYRRNNWEKHVGGCGLKNKNGRGWERGKELARSS